jgi:hypothetical protein
MFAASSGPTPISLGSGRWVWSNCGMMIGRGKSKKQWENTLYALRSGISHTSWGGDRWVSNNGRTLISRGKPKKLGEKKKHTYMCWLIRECGGIVVIRGINHKNCIINTRTSPVLLVHRKSQIHIPHTALSPYYRAVASIHPSYDYHWVNAFVITRNQCVMWIWIRSSTVTKCLWIRFEYL